MKQSLQLRLGQQLTMTPQLQQAIRLLQLSTLELQTEIRDTLEANPMLEAEEDGEADGATDADGETPPVTVADPADRPVNGEAEPHTDFSTAWTHAGYGMPDEEQREPWATRDSGDDSLHDILLEQLHLSHVGAVDRHIGMILIEAIGDDGYLHDDLDDVHATLERAGIEASLADVEVVLHLIQSFDPAGIGARDPGECLRLQLERQPADEARDDALAIIEHGIDLLAAHDLRGLCRRLRLDDARLGAAIARIRALDPHPGTRHAQKLAHYVVPDVFVCRERGIWRVRLNPEIAPRLRINPVYSNLVKRADHSSDNTFLRDHLQEARWFIKSLESRNDTMLRVATAIIEHQRPFLEYGEEAMKPLVLRDIAEQLGMHESTISRVSTEKYMHTPRGTLEFRYFFSSHVNTRDGGECSATAIRAMMQRLIADESPRKPLSDARLTEMLNQQGIDVARRTVAKYRESMAIPPSSQRKRLD